MIRENDMILAKDVYVNMNDFETRLNNNVLVVGSSGCGKTRSVVSPNILQASGSYVISDPKGTLYKKYGKYLASKGYDVKILDFIHPERSSHYNFFRYIHTEKDVMQMAHMLTYVMESFSKEPFWDMATELLLSSLIGLVSFRCKPKEQTLHNLLKLVNACQIDENDSGKENYLDTLMEEERENHGDSFVYRQYCKFRIAAGRTLKSILITVNAKLGQFDYEELNEMLSRDEMDIISLGKSKRAIFVIVSDTDRSLDPLANLFYSQVMNKLCQFADDEGRNGRLAVPVRFILDDFATNCKIANFQNMISNIRSRGISAMIMIQAESQLRAAYGEDGRTIAANCDTYIYMGGNDIDTAKDVAARCDLPYRKVLNMPIGTNWIFRRGQEPIYGENFELENYEKIRFPKPDKDELLPAV